MNEYYGVPTTSTSDYLAHYGIRGMKWGVRKAIDRTGNGRPHSKGYSKVEEKLKRITRSTGLVGGLSYMATHRDQSQSPTSYKNRQIKNSYTRSASQKGELRNNALEATKRADDAYNNLSFLGKRGFGKTAKRYRDANIAAKNATSAYYNSLTKKQYDRLRRNHVG